MIGRLQNRFHQVLSPDINIPLYAFPTPDKNNLFKDVRVSQACRVSLSLPLLPPISLPHPQLLLSLSLSLLYSSF